MWLIPVIKDYSTLQITSKLSNQIEVFQSPDAGEENKFIKLLKGFSKMFTRIIVHHSAKLKAQRRNDNVI